MKPLAENQFGLVSGAVRAWKFAPCGVQGTSGLFDIPSKSEGGRAPRHLILNEPWWRPQLLQLSLVGFRHGSDADLVSLMLSDEMLVLADPNCQSVPDVSVVKLSDTEGEKRLRSATIWLSADEDRNILKLESSVWIGSVTAEFEEFKTPEQIEAERIQKELEDQEKKEKGSPFG